MLSLFLVTHTEHEWEKSVIFVKTKDIFKSLDEVEALNY